MTLRLAILSLLFAACGCARDVTPTGPLRGAALASAVDRLAEPLISGGTVVGLSIAVTRGDSVLFARAYGHSDLARTVPCDENSIFWIASVTKTFVAATVLGLVESGKLDLGQPISAALPEVGSSWSGVTLERCLNHTSGIPDFTLEADRRVLETGVPISKPYTAEWVRAARPAFAPGARWSYTNTAFWLAGMAAERSAKEPFDSLLARAIVRPLGLTRTGFGFDPALRGRWRMFQSAGDSIADFKLINEFPVFTDGGLVSTAPELAAALRGIYGGRVLSPASLNRMTRRTATAAGEVGYGLGTRHGDVGGHRKLGHTGGMLSTLAAAAYYPDDSLAVVVLINTDGTADAPSLEAKVARLALGIPKPAMKEVPLTPEQLERLSGIFEMDSEGELKRYERRVDRGRLIERRIAEGAEPFGLIHLGNGEFAVDGWDEGRLVSPLEAPSDVVVETWGGFFGAIAYRER